VLTIEELYLFKKTYVEQIAELQRKQAVVDELIAFAESKKAVAEPAEPAESVVVEPLETETVSYATTATDGDY
jgi:hypothetical protein